MSNKTHPPALRRTVPEVSRRGFISGLVGFSAGMLCQKGAMADPPVQTVPPTQQTNIGKGVPSEAAGSGLEARVHINQVGYLPKDTKRCVVSATGPIPGGAFQIVDDDVIPETRYRGVLRDYEAGEQHGHYSHHFFADFNDFDRPGRYRLRLSDGRLSAPFSIDGDVYSRLIPLLYRYFDVQKCGDPRSEERSGCHKDDGIAVGGPRDGQHIEASGGWHDAGDYLKFVETTSYVTAMMLFSYSQLPHAFPHRSAEGKMPLLLEQARVGLDWLLKMHPEPNEFYYQVGDAEDHDTWRLPEDDCADRNRNWKPRPVFFGIGANLAGRTAASFAMASRLYRRYDAAFAARCLKAAQSVYQLGLVNPTVLTTNPADYYPEKTWADDMEWGAAALFEATGKHEYLIQALDFSKQAGAARDATSVYNTHALAHYMLYPHVDAANKSRLLGHLREDAEFARKRAGNPYALATPYMWGTAEGAAGAGISCLLYARLAKDEAPVYHEVARRQRDFILGCNPFGLCCLIGAGTRYPLFPHHQIANIKNIELSGAIVGGPADAETFHMQNIALTGRDFETQVAGPPLASDLPDEISIYHDAVQDYVTNEPANDYTVKFLLLAAFFVEPGFSSESHVI